MSAPTLEEIKASPDAVLTIRETAAVLRLDERSVSRGMDAGEIPCIRVGRRRLIPKQRLIAMLEGAV